MEKHRPRSERARRNRFNSALLLNKRRNPQHALKLIAERHLNLSDPRLPSQIQILNEKKEEKQND